MANSNTTYVFDGIVGNQRKTSVQCVASLVAAETLRTFLEAHSLAAVNAVSFSARNIYDTVPDPASNTDEVAVVNLQDTDTGNVVRFSIPAILSTDTEAVPGREGGMRTTDAFNALLKAALDTATGRTFRVLEGVVYGKK